MKLELIFQVLAQSKSRFAPSVSLIKKCIESLIEKQYLERTPNCSEEYTYVAWASTKVSWTNFFKLIFNSSKSYLCNKMYLIIEKVFRCNINLKSFNVFIPRVGQVGPADFDIFAAPWRWRVRIVGRHSTQVLNWVRPPWSHHGEGVAYDVPES